MVNLEIINPFIQKDLDNNKNFVTIEIVVNAHKIVEVSSPNPYSVFHHLEIVVLFKWIVFIPIMINFVNNENTMR